MKDLLSSATYRLLVGAFGFTFLKRSPSDVEYGVIYRPAVYKSTNPDGTLEYFVFLGRGLKQRSNFVGIFGLRNKSVDIFAYSCMLKYGSPALRDFWSKHPADFDYYCGLFRTFYRLQTDGRVLPVQHEINHDDKSILENYILSVLNEKIGPLIEATTTLQEFLRILSNDANPWEWHLTNPISRCAQIVAISLQLGLPLSDARELLRPYDRRIQADLDVSGKATDSKDHGISVDFLVNDLAEEWATCIKSK